MVMLTPLIRRLHARFGQRVDIIASGREARELLADQAGVGTIYLVSGRRLPYWLNSSQQRLVYALRARGVGPTWFLDPRGAGRHILDRAGIPPDFIIDERAFPELRTRHVIDRQHILAAETPPGLRGMIPPPVSSANDACALRISEAAQKDLYEWLLARGLLHRKLLLVQVGNRRTMRRGDPARASNVKYWPVDRWAAVLRSVRDECADAAIVMIGVAQESPLNEAILHAAGTCDSHNVAGELPVSRLAALLAHAETLVTVDTGPAHVAAAVGCPQVVLFATAAPEIFAPRSTSHTPVLCLQGIVDDAPSILGITPEMVLDAWRQIRPSQEPSQFPSELAPRVA
jgi:heptosyltransferase-2/heptosyltransferase-3